MLIALLHLGAQGQTSVIMHRNNLKRTGWNATETSLNPSNVTAQTFGKVFTRTVDDQVYAQPLVITNVQIADTMHNLLLVATVNNSVYAFDADEASLANPYWKVNLTPAGSRPPKNTDMTGACDGNYRDFTGNIGIVGTPAIDLASNTMYLVSRNLKTDGSGIYQQFLHALDIRTGQEKTNSPVLITATSYGNGDGSVNGIITFDAQKQNQRVALLLYNNVVYIAWASHCDWGPYHGWFIGYDATTLQQKYVYNASPEGANAGFWMSGQGPSVDDQGNFYIATGNGTVGLNNDPNDPTNRGESLLKMTPDLKVLDFFTPSDYPYLEDNDLDYGTDGVLLIPNTNYSLSGSKEAYLYMIDNNNMGKMNATESNVIQKIDINASNPNWMRHIHGAPVYYKNNTNQEYIYIWSENALFRQIPFNRNTMRFDVNNQINSTLVLPNGMPGGFMSVSSDGQNPNTGIVWVSHPYQGDANQAVVPGILRAFDANDIRKELWNTNMNADDGYGNFAKFVSPTVANGKVYMATFSNVINVYGVKSSSVLKDPEIVANPANGLDYSYYEGSWNYIPKYATLTPVKNGTTTNFLMDQRNQDDNFGFEYKGYIEVPADGYYTFYTNSDDGSRLYIGNKLIVDNDGLHGTQEASGVIGLKAGKHSITVDYFELGGEQVLTVSYSGPGINKQEVPSAALYRSGTTSNQSPYLGTPWNIPGKIEAENYDAGGEGIAFHDLTPGNSGNAYRTEDVDMEASTDVNGGYNVGWIDAGEWLEYTVNVTQAGSYRIDTRVASTSGGQTFHIELDGQTISGTITVPNTGAWQNWQTISLTTPALTTGQKVMRIVMESSLFNINYINFSPIVTNNPPVVSITSPLNNASFNEGTVINISANASDSDGTISKVEFFVDGQSIGSSATSPYSINYTTKVGTHTISAVATDDKGAATTSSSISINVNGINNAPSVNITSPANNSIFNEGTVVSIIANAQDSDGSVSKVEFFVDGQSIGSATASPYSVNYTTKAGTHTINAIATDDKGASTTSSSISINVNGVNNAPTVTITSPANNSTFNEGTVVSITANAQDSDGSVSNVEFFVDGQSIGSASASPYSINYTAIAGTHLLTAVATDNKLATATSAPISIIVNVNNNTCTGVAPYVDNGGYVAGSKVQNQGNQYECKPWPYSGWCNGAAWAYGPGTGLYWSDAWTLIGACNAKMGLQGNSSEENKIEVFPNPVEYAATIKLNVSLLEHAQLVITNSLGMEVFKGELNSSSETQLNLSKLESGIYVIRIISNETTYERKFVKQ